VTKKNLHQRSDSGVLCAYILVRGPEAGDGQSTSARTARPAHRSTMTGAGGGIVGRSHRLGRRELVTTLTELKAIIAPAIIGCRWKPRGRKTPMASGIPSTLYMHAQMRLSLIVSNIEHERSRAATTSSRSDRMSLMSAASITTDMPEETAMPTVAASSAGESLIPSPT